MKNIHVLPTENESRLRYNSFNKVYELCEFPRYHTDIKSTHHIYITSDEEIKEDYVIAYGVVIKVMMFNKETLYFINGTKAKREDCKKIILTTDQDLIKDGVQAINDNFLEWFVKNPSCEEVETVFNNRGITGAEKIFKTFGEYKIIIPKEEPKQETQGYICPQTKKQCDDECCVSAEDCHIEASFGIISDCEPSKQETFEEVVKPLMKWLCENTHPHTTIIVRSNSAELVEGIKVIETNEFLID